MFTMETSISYDCLYNLFEKNLRYLQRAYDYHDFESALKELDGTFITTYKVEDSIKVSYQNPSIFDFLFSYYSKERRDDLVPIIQNALYLDQIVHRFTAINPTFKLGRIQVTPKLLDVIAQKIIEGLDKLPWSEESVSASKRHIFSFRNTPKFTQVLDTLLFTLDLKENSTLRSYLLQQFIKENSVFAAKNAETYSQIDLLKYFVEELDDEQRAEAIDKAARSICSYEDVDYFLGLEDEADLAESFAEWMADNSLSEITTEIVAEEICNLDSDTAFNYRDILSDLSNRYEFDHQYAENLYEDTLRDFQREPDYDEVLLDDNLIPHTQPHTVTAPRDEDSEIKDMFESLRSSS